MLYCSTRNEPRLGAAGSVAGLAAELVIGAASSLAAVGWQVTPFE